MNLLLSMKTMLHTVASDLGGVRLPMVVSWPGHISGTGEVCSDFIHITDVAPTLFEVAGIQAPSVVHGVEQMPLEGKSFSYTFQRPEHSERPRIQYFEIFGSRGIIRTDGGPVHQKVPYGIKGVVHRFPLQISVPGNYTTSRKTTARLMMCPGNIRKNFRNCRRFLTQKRNATTCTRWNRNFSVPNQPLKQDGPNLFITEAANEFLPQQLRLWLERHIRSQQK